MKIHPLQDRVLAKRLANNERASSGLFVPHNAKANPLEALLISMGKDEITKSDRVPAATRSIKTGDKGLSGHDSASLLDLNDGGHIILEQVLGELSSLARNVALGFEICGRVKSIQSILFKMRTNHLGIDQVLDYFGVRIIMPRTGECYRLVEQIHRTFKVIEGEYNDYIQSPKPNGYRSLHTTVIASNGNPIEVQVRTPWMHALAQRGTSAHWIYKKRRTLTGT